MEIHSIIKELRKSRGLTQVDVANELNCNRQKIADWERGKSTPSAEDIVALTELFGVSSDYLLGITQAATVDKDIQAICDFTGLSSEAVEIIKGDGYYSYIREILNFYLQRPIPILGTSFKRNSAFTGFCGSLIEYKQSLTDFIAFYKESIEHTALPFEDLENLVKEESTHVDRVNAAEYRIQKNALKMAELFCEEQTQEIDRYKDRFYTDITHLYVQIKDGEQDGEDTTEE